MPTASSVTATRHGQDQARGEAGGERGEEEEPVMVCGFPHILAGFCAEFRLSMPAAESPIFEEIQHFQGLICESGWPSDLAWVLHIYRQAARHIPAVKSAGGRNAWP
jgi:hypothetical protein